MEDATPHAISKTNKSHQSALPNGLIGDLWFAAADAAQVEIGWLVWLSLICGLRAAAGRTAPQREDKPTKTNQLTRNSFLWDEMKWNPTKKWNWAASGE